MSAEWFIQAHEHGDDQPIRTDLVNACLNGWSCVFNDGSVDVVFDRADSSTFFYGHTEPHISELMISRPCRHSGLTGILFDIMKLGNFVFYAPDAEFPIVLDEAVIKELPPDMLDAMGTPKIASIREEFERLISSL